LRGTKLLRAGQKKKKKDAVEAGRDGLIGGCSSLLGPQEGNRVAAEAERCQGPLWAHLLRGGEHLELCTGTVRACVRAWVCAHVYSGRVYRGHACVCVRACVLRVHGRGGGGRATWPR
jgi:hypothetical protein